MPTRILVVDDDAHIREVAQFALEKAGLEVVEAGDGQQALELFSSIKAGLGDSRYHHAGNGRFRGLPRDSQERGNTDSFSVLARR